MMKTIRLSEVGAEAAARSASAILRAGGVILYPTDTLYGLGANALSSRAVAKIKRIKGRAENKPIHALVADLTMAEEYVRVNEAARRLAEHFWPGALTLIFEKKRGVKGGIAEGIETFGARAADHPFCEALAREFGKPYTGTSANKSGEEPQRSVEDILAQLGKAAQHIDLVIDAGRLPKREPSTVVEVLTNKAAVLREGEISVSDIWNVLRPEL